MIGRVLLMLTVVGCVLTSATGEDVSGELVKQGVDQYNQFLNSGQDLGGECSVELDGLNSAKAKALSEYKGPKTREEVERFVKEKVAQQGRSGSEEDTVKAALEPLLKQLTEVLSQLKNGDGCKVKAELVCKDKKCVKCDEAGEKYAEVCNGIKGAANTDVGEIAGKLTKSGGGKVAVGGSGMLVGLVYSFLY